MQLCAKGYPNRFRNSREKREQTNKQTERHFRFYISRDGAIFEQIINQAQP